MTLLFAAVLGWCGAKWPGWWWGSHGPYGPGKPQPQPWRVFGGLIGAAGGIGAVLVFRAELAGAGLAMTVATAFFGGFFLGDVASSVAGLGSSRAIAG